MSIRIHVLVDETGKRHEVSEGIYRQLLGLDDVIEDGERVKVPLHLRDRRSPASDQRFAPVTDAMRAEIESSAARVPFSIDQRLAR